MTSGTGTLSQAVSNGRFVADMRTDYLYTSGTYYFPGLYTAVLPMIPGIWAIRRVIRASRMPVESRGRKYASV